MLQMLFPQGADQSRALSYTWHLLQHCFVLLASFLLNPHLALTSLPFHRVTCGLSSFRNMWKYLSPLRTRITENHDPQHSLLLLPWVVLKQWIPIAINGSKWLSSLLVWRNDEQDNCRFIFTRTRSQNWHGLMTMASWANSFLPVTSSRILMQGLVH